MLQIKSLHAKLQDTEILRGVDLEVSPGELHVILGPNGAGKSTLGRVLLGDEVFDVTGEITFDGQDFTELEPSARAKAGFFLSFQSPPELDGISAKELLWGAKKALDENFRSSFRFTKAFKSHLSEMRLGEEFVDREMNKGASGGERRKMEMTSLLTLDPKCAFLDEVDSGIDVDGMHAAAKAIKDFMSQDGKSIILMSHTEKFLKMVDPTHVHVLVAGRIVKSGGLEVVDEVHEKGFEPFMNE